MITPSELRLSADRKYVHVTFNGVATALSAEQLRVESPSAEVRGHGGPKKLVAGKQHVTITGVEPVGNYAVKLVFSDGHRTGIYSWVFLSDLCHNGQALWQTYLDDLQKAGLSREEKPCAS